MAQQKQFKFTEEIREKVLKFGECYYGASNLEEKGSYLEFLSALNKAHPEINLKSHVTFFKYFPGLIEKWKRDFGQTFRSKPLTKQFKQAAEETFIEVLSSLESPRFRSIGYDDLFQLADERNQDLHLLQDHKPKTLKNNFHLDKLKKAANERRAPKAGEQAPCAANAILLRPDHTTLPLPEALQVEPGLGRRENDLNPANEGPCIAAQGLGPRAADAARGGAVGAAAERMRSPVPAMGTGDPFDFTGEYDYTRRIGGMHLGEDASVSLEDPPAPASVSDGSAGVEGLSDGADCDGRASMEAGAAATGCEGPAAVAVLPATGEAAEATAASGDSKEAEGPGGNGSASVTGGQLPIAPALDLPAAFSSESMIDVGTQGLQDEMQCDSGDLTDFTPCICCVEITYDKALVCICSTQCIIPNAFKNLILSMLQEMQIQSLQT